MVRTIARWLGAAGLIVGIGLGLGASTALAATSGGFDDPTCRPSSAHPDPVVLLHGLGGNGPGNMGLIGQRLASDGYCAFELTYGEPLPPIPVGGLIDIHRSAEQIAAFITKVRSETGAAKVDLVGHSEGAFQSLYVPKVLGLSGQIGRVVALAPPAHGTTFGGLYDLAYVLGSTSRGLVGQLLTILGCPACDQLGVGGSAVAQLNHGPIAQPGVAYTIIASRSDELVTPHESGATAEAAFVKEPGVTNEYVQTACPHDTVGHIGLAYDEDVLDMIVGGLDPADPVPITCSVGLPF